MIGGRRARSCLWHGRTPAASIHLERRGTVFEPTGRRAGVVAGSLSHELSPDRRRGRSPAPRVRGVRGVRRSARRVAPVDGVHPSAGRGVGRLHRIQRAHLSAHTARESPADACRRRRLLRRLRRTLPDAACSTRRTCGATSRSRLGSSRWPSTPPSTPTRGAGPAESVGLLRPGRDPRPGPATPSAGCGTRARRSRALRPSPAGTCPRTRRRSA